MEQARLLAATWEPVGQQAPRHPACRTRRLWAIAASVLGTLVLVCVGVELSGRRVVATATVNGGGDITTLHWIPFDPPPGPGSDRWRCLKANRQEGSSGEFYYDYNEGRGTPEAVCGPHVNSSCCKRRREFAKHGCNTLKREQCCHSRDGRAAFKGDTCVLVTFSKISSWTTDVTCLPSRLVTHAKVVPCGLEAEKKKKKPPAPKPMDAAYAHQTACKNYPDVQLGDSTEANSIAQCAQNCENKRGCFGFQYQEKASCPGEKFESIGTCVLLRDLKCDRLVSTCWAQYARVQAGTTGRPIPFPSLGIPVAGGKGKPKPKLHKRKGSFIAFGDWGWDAGEHGDIQSPDCQKAVAEKMLETMRQLGDVKFVINVGDSFYPNGVKSKADPRWDSQWRNIYDPLLRSVPWYSVYGNHDLQHDPCTCGLECGLVNADKNDLRFLYMPNYTYFEELPDLGLEIVALDLNHYMWGWGGNATPMEQRVPGACMYTPCYGDCRINLKRRSDESLNLLYERSELSTAKNMIVFSHYPTDYMTTEPQFLATLSDPARKVTFFGGHRHNIDQSSVVSTAPNTNWLAGGGGGWSCEPYDHSQGFVVGEVAEDFELKTYAVTVDPNLCCKP